MTTDKLAIDGGTPLRTERFGNVHTLGEPEIEAESRTYGESGYPFVDECGGRRIDYREVRLPVVEDELPRMLKVGGNSSHTERDAEDIGNAIRKVALHYAPRR